MTIYKIQSELHTDSLQILWRCCCCWRWFFFFGGIVWKRTENGNKFKHKNEKPSANEEWKIEEKEVKVSIKGKHHSSMWLFANVYGLNWREKKAARKRKQIIWLTCLGTMKVRVLCPFKLIYLELRMKMT